MKTERIRAFFQLSQQECADILSISRSTIAMLERGSRIGCRKSDELVELIYEAMNNEANRATAQAIERILLKHQADLQIEKSLELSKLDQKRYSKNLELSRAKHEFDLTLKRYKAVYHLESIFGEQSADSREILLKWLEKTRLETEFSIIRKGLREIHKIERDIHLLEAHIEYLKAKEIG